MSLSVVNSRGFQSVSHEDLHERVRMFTPPTSPVVLVQHETFQVDRAPVIYQIDLFLLIKCTRVCCTYKC